VCPGTCNGLWNGQVVASGGKLFFAGDDGAHGLELWTSDGTIGYISDFVMDDETWAVRYLVVDTRNRRPSRQALIDPAWIAAASWADRTIDVDLPGALIKAAPAYDPTWLNRTFEQGLYQHYQRPAYWDEPAAA